jgi:phosphoenolpyruvate carboxykinase (GTP)
MAMLPFCGYNMGRYFRHWLDVPQRASNPPKVFNVNWFKKDEDGHFIWPGYGDNLRALDWIVRRCRGQVDAQETPIGYIPNASDLNLEGLGMSATAVDALFEISRDAWMEELEGMQKFFDQFGYDLPAEFIEQQQSLKTRLGHWGK